LAHQLSFVKILKGHRWRGIQICWCF